MTRIVTVTLNPALDLSTETQTVVPEVKLRCAVPRTDPGGGGVNVSRAIAILGGESVVLAALGGPAGDEMRRLLREEGLEVVPLGVAHPTRQSLAVTERASGLQYRFVMPGPPWSAEHCASAARQFGAAIDAGDLVVASGSLPPGVPGDFFLVLHRAALAGGARMILDTSGPALAAAARGGGAPLLALRMDREEAESIADAPLPHAGALADFASGLVSRGAASIAAIANGAEGTVIATEDGRWLCRPPRVPVVSKVGAGDSFTAGFALALARGAGPVEACAEGVAAAASAVTTPATTLCERESARLYLAEVRTEPV